MRIRPFWQVIAVVVLAFVVIVRGHDRTFTGPYLTEQLYFTTPITWCETDFSRCEPNRYDENGITPLFAAAFDKNLPAVELLLSRGADPTKTIYRTGGNVLKFYEYSKSHNKFCHVDACGWTPLHMAAFHGDPDIVRALLKAGADINARGETGQTPLMAAVIQERATMNMTPRGLFFPHDMIEILIDAGADVEAVDHYGRDVLHIVRSHERGYLVPILQEAKISREYRDAAMAANYDVVKRYLDNGGKVNRYICWKGTALHYAVDNQNEELVELLVGRGASLTIGNDHSQTPLDLAREKKNEAIIRRLTAAASGK